MGDIDSNFLKKNETGERLDIERTFDWILKDMSYEDFCAFAKLRCVDTEVGYQFAYQYRCNEEHDTPEAREDYLKYLCYKLVQNIATPGVKLED